MAMSSPNFYFERRDGFRKLLDSSYCEFNLSFKNITITSEKKGTQQKIELADVNSIFDLKMDPAEVVVYFLKTYLDVDAWGD